MTLPIQYVFESHEVRALMVNGEPWFVATDVLSALQLDRKALERLDVDEKGVNSIHTPGGNQEMTVINEPGLYSLVLGSRKAEAKRFKRWVTHDVLPSLRKHGAYVMPTAKPANDPTDAPMAAHVEADQIVSAGRVFRALFTTARSLGMARRLAATRANQAAERATGVDLAGELGASDWLEGTDLPAPHRKHYELQQNLRAHLVANNWPQGITNQQVIEAMNLSFDKGTQMAVGHCLQLLGYKRTRMGSTLHNAPRAYVYVLKKLDLAQETAA
ncbi:Bro-N domain-containing protein [Pseudomonas marginalis]|uniref:Bro-N domain-containing protein n=1 Tax=Pseudomonas marginalis TaxID=298 RepID=A0A9X9BS93_PSEMA|nr:Bro-N domain-containing protein [Pseudomonas marginalis]TWR59764.1 Bro-N domain-containing protein [Pseudomonas marginalis]SED27126.1 BRO family, N-terminal domain [Pseudomonas marginalis]